MQNYCRVVTVAVSALVYVSGVQAVNIQTVHVGNQGNAGEWSGESYGGYGPDHMCGAVNYIYNIGKYEVTAGQYTDFLNAVATTDSYGLYNENMWSSDYGCKIQRSGSANNYTYSVAADYVNRPVNYVSWGDAARFSNWLHNGQTTGAQGLNTTEDGAYDLSGTHSYYNPDGSCNDPSGLSTALLNVTRNANATWVIPSEDEWYKAAYHKNDGVTGNYWDYTTSTDVKPNNDLGDPDPGNNATYWDNGYTIGSPYYRTEVGTHEDSDSPYGTFDQGGNLWEWDEAIIYDSFSNISFRGIRGGAFDNYDVRGLHAADRISYYASAETLNIGFRIVEVPEPASLSLLTLGGLALFRRRR